MTTERISARIYHITGHQTEALAHGLVKIAQLTEGDLYDPNTETTIFRQIQRREMPITGRIPSIGATGERVTLKYGINNDLGILNSENPAPDVEDLTRRTAELWDGFAGQQ